jgi:energy-coupling factor transporter ATP-binding protein EcfA2
MKDDPTLLGYVGQVTGATVSVKQVATISSGLAIIDGRTYRIGQVGGFVRIPQGYLDLFGVVSQVGSDAIPEALRATEGQGSRWLTVQLIGESIGSAFERGISQHPAVADEVHLVTETDLRKIYGVSGAGQVVIGRLASAESIEVRLDLDKLVTRHCAVLGSTGSGKSTTVASLLRAISANAGEDRDGGYPSARILLLDIHGEYAKALEDVAKVFRINAKPGEEELHIPYWALDFQDLIDFLTGGTAEEKLMHFRDKIVELKNDSLKLKPRPGADPASLTVDTPVPFSLKKLWFELVEQELMTFEGPNRDQPAVVDKGDAQTLTPPRYKPWAQDRSVVLNQRAPGIRRQLDHLRSRLLDHLFDFLLHPGAWEPDLNGQTAKDLDALLAGWLGHDKAITILDLSGVPSFVMTRLIGALLRIIYDALFWSRDKSEGGVNRPLLIVMEEAHAYLSREEDKAEGPAARLARRIAKEGRKYGIGAMIVSQRPSEVDESILSQCGTFVALRLSNPKDRSQVQGTVPDNLEGLMDMLPVLRTGEAIITGEAARLPMRVRIALPRADRRPDSEDPDVTGRWRLPRLREDYEQVVAAWRAQSPRTVKQPVKIKRLPVADKPEQET